MSVRVPPPPLDGVEVIARLHHPATIQQDIPSTKPCRELQVVSGYQDGFGLLGEEVRKASP